MVAAPSTYIIAEIGVNHNGSVTLAKELMTAAKEAGVDAVKFQTFNAHALASCNAPIAEYQCRQKSTPASQIELLQQLELKAQDHEALIQYAQQLQVDFLSSPFDQENIIFLKQLGVQRLKIPSGEVTNAPYLLTAACTGLPLIISTGMCTIEEVQQALNIIAFGVKYGDRQPTSSLLDECWADLQLRSSLSKKIALLHCTTEYPAPYDEVNLAAMKQLQEVFQLPIGYSDHTQGIHVPIAAVARGATIIEKHFTLDKKMVGPDHAASIEPFELGAMVKAIREIELAIGNETKQPTSSEQKNKLIVRKSLVALEAIKAGTKFSITNLGCKRPGSGITPFKYWAYLGQLAQRDYQIDELID